MASIKMTTGEMLNAFNYLNAIATTKFPLKGSYIISRLLKKLLPEYETVEKHRLDLVKELGTVQEDGTTRVVQGTENYKTFQARFSELQSTELDLDLPLINIAHLGDEEIEPIHFNALDKLIAHDA